MGRLPSAVLGAALLLTVLTFSPAEAQETSKDELKEEIRALQESVSAIRKDLQEIKALLSRQAPKPSGVGVEIDLADNPSKGERTAALTMIEFSDYQ